MDNPEEILNELGLSKNESKVYISLLETGQTNVTKLAHYCKIHRANVYDSLNKLIEKGLVNYIEKKKSKFFEATDPKHLMLILRDKENKLKKIIPQLTLIRKLSHSKGRAHVFEGVNAFVNILYDFLDFKEEIICYGIPKIAPELMKTKMPHFHKERLRRKIPMKHLYNHNAPKRIKFLNKKPLTEARHLPATFDSEVSTNVCGNQVIIVLWAKPITIVQIENKNLANAYKKYFRLLWEHAEND
jgi:sugar-specific transcriptional regulator TrmB